VRGLAEMLFLFRMGPVRGSAPVNEASVSRVSIILPVRDAEAFLAEAIRSVLGQTFGDWDLVIVMDQSTDRSEAIAREFAAAETRIRLMANTGRGLPAALNTGTASASGDLLARLDADDLMTADRLSRQVTLLDENPQAVIVGSQAIVIDSLSEDIGRIEVPTADSALRTALTRRNPFVHSSILMRRSAFVNAGGYRETFPLVEDYDLWLRLAAQGEIANCSASLVRYRRHRNAVSTRFGRQQRLNRQLCFLAWKRETGMIDTATQDRLGADLTECYARLDAITENPTAFEPTDLVLFRRALPHLGGSDARRISRAIGQLARATHIAWSTAARLRLQASVTSRLAYARSCRAAARHLAQVHAAPTPR
jgi:GT2 family glycosyltransferase